MRRKNWNQGAAGLLAGAAFFLAAVGCVVFATNAAGESGNSNQAGATVLVDFNSAGSTPHNPANGIYWNDAVMTHTGDHPVPLNGSADPMALVNTANANSGWTLAISNLTGWNSSGASAWLFYNGPYPAAVSSFPSTALNEFISIGNAGNPGPALSVTISGLVANRTYNVLAYGACASGSGEVTGPQTDTLTVGVSASPAAVSFNALSNSTTVVEWDNVTPSADGQIVFTIDAPNGGALNFLQVVEATSSQPPAQMPSSQSAGPNPVPAAGSAVTGETNGSYPVENPAANGGTDTSLAGSTTTGIANGAIVSQPSASGLNLQQFASNAGISQEDVRKQGNQIQSGLLELIREIQINGLDAAGTGSISNAAASLGRLSQGEMQKLIHILQNASLPSSAITNQADFLAVFQGQKEVVNQLKELAMQLAARQTRDELIAQIENLMVRQAANIRQTKTLGQQPADRLTGREKALQGIISTEQTSIGREINILSNALATAAGSSDDFSRPARAVLAAMSTNSLAQSAAAAEQLTSAGTFPDATVHQTAVRNGLSAMLRAAIADEDALTRLDQAKTRLDQATDDQKNLGAADQEASRAAPAQAERQFQIQDRAEVVNELLKPLNPPAAGYVADAQQSMNHAAAALAGAEKSNAAASAAAQNEAVKSLADARKLLDQQIASIQAFKNLPPADQLAALQNIKDQLAQAQTQDQQNPGPAADNLQNVQPDVLAAAPMAAGSLAAAMDQLGKSQPDAGAADQHLAQAQQVVQQEQKAIEAAQQYKALADELERARQKATAADQTLQQTNGANLSDAAGELSEAQNLVRQVVQNPPENLPAAAGQSLQKAADEFQNGSAHASQSHPSEAHDQTQKGLADLAQAVQAMGGGGGGGGGGGSGSGAGEAGKAPGSGSGTGNAGGGPGGVRDMVAGTGPRGGLGFVVGELSPKDREAISQLQEEKTPPEYVPMVQQYYKNLADTSPAR